MLSYQRCKRPDAFYVLSDNIYTIQLEKPLDVARSERAKLPPIVSCNERSNTRSEIQTRF